VRCFLEGRGVQTFHRGATHNGGVDEIDLRDLAQRIETFLLGNAKATGARG
jgi:hypothetical protein